MVSEIAPPEFSRAVPLSEIGSTAKPRHLIADEAERGALARRFGLLALDRLEADVTLQAEGGGYLAQGQLQGDAVQPCVASGEPVAAHIDEAFAVRFVAEAAYDAEAEVELDADDCDTLFHDGRTIDLGEAVAQSFALALDPFPRSISADAVLKAAGVKDESEAGPFGALAALKEKLGKS
ncbi:MAG: YceD family protein [Sphingorhabdus sp.]